MLTVETVKRLMNFKDIEANNEIASKQKWNQQLRKYFSHKNRV